MCCVFGACDFCFDFGVGNGGAAAGLREGKHVFFRGGKGVAPRERFERRKRNVSSFCIVALTKFEVKTQFK